MQFDCSSNACQADLLVGCGCPLASAQRTCSSTCLCSLGGVRARLDLPSAFQPNKQPMHAPGCCVRLLPAGMSSRRRSAGGGSSRSGRSARRARQQQQQTARCVARLSSYCLPNKSPRWAAAATACAQFLLVQHSRTLSTMAIVRHWEGFQRGGSWPFGKGVWSMPV